MARSLPPCPACRGKAYGPGRHTKGIDDLPAELRRCVRCDALVCVSALSRASDEAMSASSGAFYVAPASKSEMDPMRSVLGFLIEQVPDLKRGRMIDFGAGRGALAAASTEIFSECWGLDLNTDTLDRCVPAFGADVRIGRDLRQVQGEVDAVILWHVAEHLPDVLGVFRSIAARLAPGGVVFWQVPRYRPEYVVSSHYTFFNEWSAKQLCWNAGLECLNVWDDKENGFLTVLGQMASPALDRDLGSAVVKDATNPSYRETLLHAS